MLRLSESAVGSADGRALRAVERAGLSLLLLLLLRALLLLLRASPLLLSALLFFAQVFRLCRAPGRHKLDYKAAFAAENSVTIYRCEASNRNAPRYATPCSDIACVACSHSYYTQLDTPFSEVATPASTATPSHW
jgi:hypothetical protein